MAKTQKKLMALFAAAIVVALLLVVVYETNILLPGDKTGAATEKFVVAVVMELSTILLIPLALYLFRIPFVRRQLTSDRPAAKLMGWGSVRIAMLGVPMVVNTFCYYHFGLEVSFGYMAIILFLCMFMIYPSMGRCVAETTPDDAASQQAGDETNQEKA